MQYLEYLEIIQVEVENENAGKEIYRHKLDSNSWRLGFIKFFIFHKSFCINL